MSQMQLGEAAPAARMAASVRRSLELGEGGSAIARARSLPAWGFVALSVLIVGAMVAGGMASARSCRVRPIPLTLGAGTEISIAVPAETPCTLVVRTGGAALGEMTVDAPPRSGTLTPRGRTGVVYRPDRGFKGDDAFAFTLRSSSARASSVVRVRAVVD